MLGDSTAYVNHLESNLKGSFRSDPRHSDLVGMCVLHNPGDSHTIFLGARL